jgi:hypothetical protein
MTIRGIRLLAAAAVLAMPLSASAQVSGNVYLKTVRVTAVPRPPNGNWWDPNPINFLGSLITKTSASLYPDIEICIGGRAACRLVCVNAQLNADDPDLRPNCGLALAAGLRVAELVEVNGQRQWRPRDLEFEVNDIGEDGSTFNRRTIGRLAFYAGADPPILQPDRCSESEPCTRTIQMEGGPLTMSFTTVFAGVVGTLPPPDLPGAPTDPGAPAAPGEAATKTGDASYYDRVKKWWNDFLWDEAKKPAGFRGTVIVGLAEQAAKARTNYAECLLNAIKNPNLNLESRFEKVCTGRSGDALTSCAYQVVAEDHADVAQACQTNELTYGFLANMWRSACGIVKMTC